MKLGWRVFVVVAAMGVGVYLSRKPWEVYRDQQGKVSSATAEMQAAEQERERLMKEKMKYGSALGREQKMRDAGWIKPGEQLIEK
jgi:cell division protein FtsB